MTSQLSLFPAPVGVGRDSSPATSTTFADNMRLPVHRWYRYSAGFSGAWAQRLIEDECVLRETRVLDPFAGSGTTLIAAENSSAPSIGIEAHPFVRRVAEAKLARGSSIEDFQKHSQRVLAEAVRQSHHLDRYPKLIRACYTDESLAELDRLRSAVEMLEDGTSAARLTWLALVAILRRCSHAGTAQWQYVLPKKTKKNSADPISAFTAACNSMAGDMRSAPAVPMGSNAALLSSDARSCEGVPDGFATLVVTSPPYPNNYDYADATRLEMCFLGEIDGWGDLQSSVRKHLVRSCTQHVPERAVDLTAVLAAPELSCIRAELESVCDQLAEVRLTKGGKKTYHLMVACYLLDLARTWIALRRACASPSRVCFVVGDSAPYGVYVPVIDWLGKLAMAAGFQAFRFDRTRDRNVKWKNRKHRVPLCEGRLWVEG